MEIQIERPVEYDSNGRMKYHPDFHANHNKTWTEEDLEYLCKYSEFDEIQNICLALERTFGTVADMKKKLKSKGMYEYYKNLNKHW